MLLKYLFIITLIILFVPPVRRFVFYLLVGRQLVKQQRQANGFERRQEGDIRVDNKSPKGDEPFKGDDYVDYEEVK